MATKDPHVRKPQNLSLTVEARRMLEHLSREHGMSKTGYVEFLIRSEYRKARR